MSGFDCDYTEGKPDWLDDQCPICKLILCEPYQVTCCGKSFCRACIQRIEAENKLCPTCNKENFESYHDKRLQHQLYELKVFCSNKKIDCDWQGELGQLNDHLNSNPDKKKRLIGCAYEDLKCSFCEELTLRGKIEDHQGSQCAKRPFTCSMCEGYDSTYDDVITNHTPVCKCRPVECPNSCGANNLQHQHLEEHVSTQCPLSYVDCEFSDAGCDAKMYRKDLSSHMENMASHMLLLARENRKLKLHLERQDKKIQDLENKLEKNSQEQEQILSQKLEKYSREQEKKLKENSQKQEQKIQEHEVQIKKHKLDIEKNTKKAQKQPQELNAKVEEGYNRAKNLVDSKLPVHFPPVDLVCCNVTKEWYSEPFYSHNGGHKLKLYHHPAHSIYRHNFGYRVIESEFPVELPFELEITVHIIHPNNGEYYEMKNTHKIYKNTEQVSIHSVSRAIFQRYIGDNNHMSFRVIEVKLL